MKKTEWTMETLDNPSAFMRNISSNTIMKHKNTITEEVLDKILDKAKQEIRCGENKAYNADFTMGCEYAISVIERMFEEVEE